MAQEIIISAEQVEKAKTLYEKTLDRYNKAVESGDSKAEWALECRLADFERMLNIFGIEY